MLERPLAIASTEMLVEPTRICLYPRRDGSVKGVQGRSWQTGTAE
jgi:hypothetical protein